MSYPLVPSNDYVPAGLPVGRIDPGPKTTKLKAYSAAVENMVKARKEMDATAVQANVVPAPGYVPQDDKFMASMRSGLRTNYAKAKQDADAAFQPISKDIEDFKLSMLNTQSIQELMTPGADGIPRPDKGKIQAKVDKWVTENGGSAALTDMIAADVEVKARASQVENKAKDYFENELKILNAGGQLKLIGARPEMQKQMSRFKAVLQNGVDVAMSNNRQRIETGVAKLKTAYEPRMQELEAIYGVMRSRVRDEMVSDVISNAQFAIDQKAAELEKAVANGVMPEVAQVQMNEFVRQQQAQMTDELKSPVFEEKVKASFAQQFGDEYQERYKSIAADFNAEVKAIVDKSNARAKRQIDEINDIGTKAAKELGEMFSKVDPESLSVMKKTFEMAYDRAAREQIKAESDATEKEYLKAFRIAGTGDIPSAFNASKKLMGESFGQNIGNMMQNLGYALTSSGAEGAFVDWLKQKGGTMFSENYRANPELKAWHFLSPAFAAQQVGQLAYSLPALGAGAAVSLITGGAAIPATAYALMNGVFNGGVNAGDTYEQYLMDNPNDFDGASRAASRMFARNWATLPMDAVIGRFWFGKKSLGSYLGSVLSEGVTESYESGAQQAILKPITGNAFMDTMNYWRSKQALTEGVMASYGTAVSGGAGLLGGRLRAALSTKAMPEVQHIAGLIADRSASYAKATFAGAGEQFENAIAARVDRIEAAMNDAKAAGVTDKKYLLAYAELSEQANVEREKLARIQNPAIREKQEAKVKAIEDTMGKVIDGTHKVALLTIGPTQVAVEEATAKKLLASPAMQEGISEGVVTVDSDNADIVKAVEAAVAPVEAPEVTPVADVAKDVTAAVVDNLEDVDTNTPVGKTVAKLVDDGAAPEVIAQEVTTAVAEMGKDKAEQVFGPEISATAMVAAIRAMKVDTVQEDVRQNTVQDSVQASTETEATGEVAVEVAGKSDEMVDSELRKIVGNEGIKSIQKAEDEIGVGKLDRRRIIDNAISIQKSENKDKLFPAHVFEALQFEFGYADNWSDLRSAIEKGGMKINAGDVKRIIDVGIKLPDDIVDAYVKYTQTPEITQPEPEKVPSTKISKTETKKKSADSDRREEIIVQLSEAIERAKVKGNIDGVKSMQAKLDAIRSGNDFNYTDVTEELIRGVGNSIAVLQSGVGRDAGITTKKSVNTKEKVEEPKPVSQAKPDNGDMKEYGSVVEESDNDLPLPMKSRPKRVFQTREQSGVKEVKGVRTEIKEYPNLKLFSYENKDQQIMEEYYGGTPKPEVNIVEIKSGLSIGSGRTHTDAYNAARNALLWQQIFNKEYPSIYEQVDKHIEKFGASLDGSEKYGMSEKYIPSDKEKISFLEGRIKAMEAEIESKNRSAIGIIGGANTDMEERNIKSIKSRISEIKSQSKPTQDERQEKGKEELLEASPAPEETTEPVSRNSEAKKAFRDKFDFNMELLKKSTLTPEGKVKKLESMSKALQDAKTNKVIDQDEFDDKYEQLANQRVKIMGNSKAVKAKEKEVKAETERKPKAESKPVVKEAKPEPAPEPEATVDIDPKLLEDAKEPWGTYKYRHPEATKEEYYALRDQLSRATKIASSIRAAKVDTNGKAYDVTLGLPIAVYNGVLETLATAIEAGETIAEAIELAVDYVMASAKKGTYRKPSVRKQVRSIAISAAMMQPKERKGSARINTRKNIINSGYRGSENVTFREYFKAINIRQKDMVTSIKKLQMEAIKYFKQNKIDLSGKMALKAMKVISDMGQVNYKEFSEYAINEAIDKIDAIIEEQERMDSIAETERQLKEFKFRFEQKLKQDDKQRERDERFERRRIRDIFMHYFRGQKAMAEIIEEVQKEVAAYFRKNGIDMSKGRIAKVMRQVSLLSTTEAADNASEAILDAIEAIDTIIAEQEFANEIKEARGIIRKFDKFRRKSAGLNDTYKQKLQEIDLLSPTKVILAGGDLKQYVDAMIQITAAFGSNQGIRELTMANLEAMVKEMKRLKAILADYELKRDQEKYQAALATGETQAQNYEEWLQDRADKTSANRYEKKIEQQAKGAAVMDKFHELIKVQKDMLKSFIEELDIQYQDDTGNMEYKLLRGTAQELLDLSAENMHPEGLREFNSVLNNVVNDGITTNAIRFISFWKAVETMDTIEKNPMRIRGPKMKNWMSLSGLFNSLTFNDKDAAKLREILFGAINRATDKVHRMFYSDDPKKQGIMERLNTIINKFEDGQHSRSIHRVGVYQFLSQAESEIDSDGNEVVSRNDDFKERLRVLIQGSMVNRYNKAAAEAHKNKDIKYQMEEAKLVGDALISMGLIKGYRVVGGEMLVDEILDVSVDQLPKELQGAEKELYDYIRAKFSEPEYLAKMRHVSEGLYGIVWNAKEGYAPQVPRPLGGNMFADAKAQIEAIGNGDHTGTGMRKVGVRPSDRFKQRGQLADPEKYYYSTDAASNFLTAFYESNMAIDGGRDMKTLSYVLNSKEFEAFINGAWNKMIYGYERRFQGASSMKSQYAYILKRFASIMKDSVNPPYLRKDSREFAAQVYHWLVGGLTGTVLNTVDQMVKQPVPNLVYGSMVSGVPETYVAMRAMIDALHDPAKREALRVFSMNFQGDMRSARGEEFLDEVNKLVSEYDKKFAIMLRLSEFKDNASVTIGGKKIPALPSSIGKIIFKRFDAATYLVNAIAAYIHAEVREGRIKSAFDFDLESAANADPLSVSEALNVAEMLNNASKASERAPITRAITGDMDPQDKAVNYLRHVFFLKGFSLNAAMQAANNISIMAAAGDRVSNEERKSAAIKVAGYISQATVFNAVKIGILKLAYDQLGEVLMESILGMTPKEETDEEKRKAKEKVMAEVVMQSAGDILLGWAPSPVEIGAKSLLNQTYSAALDMFIDDRTEKRYDNTVLDNAYKPFFSKESTGIGSLDMIMNLKDVAHDAFTQRNDPKLTPEANENLDKLDFAKLMAWTLSQGDLLKAVHATERTVRKAGIKPKKTGGATKKDSPFKIEMKMKPIQMPKFSGNGLK